MLTPFAYNLDLFSVKKQHVAIGVTYAFIGVGRCRILGGQGLEYCGGGQGGGGKTTWHRR